MNPISLAVAGGHTEVIKTLIEDGGVDPNIGHQVKIILHAGIR